MTEEHHSGGERRVYAETLGRTSQDYEALAGELSILKMLNDSIQAGIGFDEICRKLVQYVTETMKIENASVMVFDSEKEELRLLVGKSSFEDESILYRDDAWQGKTFKIGEGIAGQVARDRKSILINETANDPRFVPAQGQKVKVRSILCLPLVHGDRLHGVLNLSNSEPGTFTTKKEHVLSLIASTASVAMSRAVVVDKIKRVNIELTVRNRELAAVNALSESLHSTLDLDSVLSESLNNISDGFDVAAAAIFLRDDESNSIEMRSYSARSADPGLEDLLQSVSRRYSRQIIRLGSSGFNFGSVARLSLEQENPSHVGECIGVPLVSGEDCHGMLLILGASSVAFKETELKFLSSFCKQIGLAVHNSILVRRLRANIEKLEETRNNLIQSDKLALLGEMVSGVAHEINNPLAAIMGYSELLMDEESVSENGRDMLERTLLCVERCRRIVQGLLSFARKTELAKRPTNITGIIEKVLAQREYELAVNNIDVVKEYEIEEAVSIVDPNQMEQVFLNLLNNAFDSMVGRDVPGILEIRTSLVDDETMQIEFIDNGCGIKDGDEEKLFEPFFTTKEIGTGTGLGLSISYGIVKEHGGDLYLDDAHYCGAKFVITLPVVFDRQCLEESELTAKSSAWPKTNGKVLVVDDEDVVADVIDAALSVKGFSVDCAATGEEAYQMIDSGGYDLVISDIRMPGTMDGRQLYYEVRAQDPELAERFVFISGDVMEKSTAEFLNECGRAYLLKPFSLTDLREVIEKTLDLSHS